MISAISKCRHTYRSWFGPSKVGFTPWFSAKTHPSSIMPAAIPYHPNGSLHRRSKAVNYAKSSRRNGRSFSVQDATLSIRLSSKWADITVQMTRFHGYIYCRDCFGHYKKEECPSPGLDGQWRCRECAEECTRARGEVI